MLFALTALCSAFLLFLVQPLMGRFVLPWFGGGSTVWTVCMLFFQSGLLVGYAYAHLLALRLPLRRGVAAHAGFVAISLLALPIIPTAPEPGGAPTLGILAALGAAVALPYVVLSTTAPLIQAWSTSVDRRSPYRLYAWSNVGSIGALVAYPLLVEPLVGLEAQAVGWSVGYGVFAVALGACGWRVWRRGRPLGEGDTAPAGEGEAPPSPVLWISATALASALLLATTDRLTEDISASPFLWVLPLGLYLLSFVICFGRPRLADRRLWFTLLPVAGVAVWYAMHAGADLGLVAQIAVYDGVLFVGCMALHGEVVRARPAPAHLTGFYLATALGGALGGVLVGLVAPAALPIRLELQLTVIGVGALASVQAWRAWRVRPFAATSRWLGAAMPIAVLALAAAMGSDVHRELVGVSAVDRGFYGVLRVKDLPAVFFGSPLRKLVHGRIMHGQQYTDDRRGEPLSYYAEGSGVGAYFDWGEAAPPRQVAAVGLGIGTLAAYGRCDDTFDFYEIDPLVERFAREWFTYLDETCAATRVIIGDGRLQLDRAMARYDVIVLDAFSSDAIPAHLLTREAFGLYLDRLAPGGTIVVNIANRHLDLRPVLRGHTDALGLAALEIAAAGNFVESTAHTRWVFLARDDGGFIAAMRAAERQTGHMPDVAPIEWTDDFSPLWPLLK